MGVFRPPGSFPNRGKPAKLATPELLGFYDFANNPKVTHDNLLDTHFQRTYELMERCEGVVLIINDTWSCASVTVGSVGIARRCVEEVGSAHPTNWVTNAVTPGTAVSAIKTAPNIVAVTFSLALGSATNVIVPFRDPAIRNASGGFVSVTAKGI